MTVCIFMKGLLHRMTPKHRWQNSKWIMQIFGKLKLTQKWRRRWVSPQLLESWMSCVGKAHLKGGLRCDNWASMRVTYHGILLQSHQPAWHPIHTAQKSESQSSQCFKHSPTMPARHYPIPTTRAPKWPGILSSGGCSPQQLLGASGGDAMTWWHN